MQEKLKNINGITLVALIITVIILLILAGVTISLLIGDNGMVTKTKQGVEESEMASIKEKAELVRNEQGIRNFEKNPQELTKSSYINALNVSFEDSIVEGSRVIVKDKKYAIFVKSNLEIEVIKNDGKTLAEGEMKLDYTVSEDGLIEIYPRIGGVESYKLYAEKILEGKTQGEKEQMCLNGWKYWDPEGFANVFGEKENPTFDDWVNIENASIENEEEKISKEDLINDITFGGKFSFDERLIMLRAVKPEEFNFENYYNEIKITCPDGSQKNTDTISLGITYQVYKNGEYKFIGNVTDGEYKGTTAEVTVPVSTADKLSLKLKINITEDNKTIQLPVDPYSNIYTYDCTVDWGDSTTQKVTNANAKTTKHTYEDTGEYTVIIEGTYECLYNSGGLQQTLKKIEQWGVTGLKRINLSGCTNLEEIAEPAKKSFAKIASFEGAFSGCSSLVNIPENLFVNCSNVMSFGYTFRGCSSLVNIPENLFANCSNVTNFFQTFAWCNSLTNIPEKLFSNCSNAENFKWTFIRCSKLKNIPENLFAKCLNVTDFCGTFAYCEELEGKSIELWKDGRKGIDENNGGDGCYYMCEKLTDYSTIPEFWKQEVYDGPV